MENAEQHSNSTHWAYILSIFFPLWAAETDELSRNKDLIFMEIISQEKERKKIKKMDEVDLGLL